MQVIGKVLWWDNRDKEGVIVDANGREIYFNASVFPESSRQKSLEGKFVWFTLNKDIPHVLTAKSVSTVPSSSISKAKENFEKGLKRNSPSIAA